MNSSLTIANIELKGIISHVNYLLELVKEGYGYTAIIVNDMMERIHKAGVHLVKTFNDSDMFIIDTMLDTIHDHMTYVNKKLDKGEFVTSTMLGFIKNDTKELITYIDKLYNINSQVR